MVKKDPLKELFDSLLDDEADKEIIRMIIKGKKSDEIIDSLLNNKDGR